MLLLNKQTNKQAKDMKSENTKDYGADPLGNGNFRMIPSGDIVGRTERDARLARKREVVNDCLGISWEQIERMQGGKLTR